MLLVLEAKSSNPSSKPHNKTGVSSVTRKRFRTCCLICPLVVESFVRFPVSGTHSRVVLNNARNNQRRMYALGMWIEKPFVCSLRPTWTSHIRRARDSSVRTAPLLFVSQPNVCGLDVRRKIVCQRCLTSSSAGIDCAASSQSGRLTTAAPYISFSESASGGPICTCYRDFCTSPLVCMCSHL